MEYPTFRHLLDTAPEEVAAEIYGPRELAPTQPYVPLCIDGASSNPVLEACMAKILREVFEVFKAKQQKYGPGNIAELGLTGILSRLSSDKYQRLKRIIPQVQAVHDAGKDWADDDDVETVTDSLLDAADYPAIMLAYFRGWWPEAPADPDRPPRFIIEDGNVYIEDGESKRKLDIDGEALDLLLAVLHQVPEFE
jgi:hypothetical protein